MSARTQTCRRARERVRARARQSVRTPATHDMKEDLPQPLDEVQHSKYRSQVARCVFLCPDRADMTFIVNELYQRMSNRAQQSLALLKRLVRYLKRERQWEAHIQVWKHGRRSDDIFRFRLGRLKRNSTIIKRRCDTARQPHLESIHAQAQDHCKKQRRSRAVCCSIVTV